MLLELAVRDLALIERARISFPAGFTVITGETGAGKSLLIDALALVMGGRGDSSLVRHGAQAARVEALFEREPEPLICVREIAAGGRSVARVDDESVTVTRLAAVVGPLVEIHGQHEQQRLLQAGWQRDALDAFGEHAVLRGEVASAVHRWRSNEAVLRGLTVAPIELERRLQLAEHAAAEIEAGAPRPGEIEELRARLAIAASGERIRTLLGETDRALAAEGRGAREELGRASRSLAALARLDGAYEELAERAAGLAAEIDELVLELRRRMDQLQGESPDAARVEERLGLLYGLLRKYGEDEAAVLAYAAEARAEADRLRGQEQERSRRERDAGLLEEHARELAARLSSARASAAARLSEEVTAGLRQLGFPEGAFSIDLSPRSLDETGGDEASFLLTPNLGEPPRPLARIASGGELARVALALKVVLARADMTPTLVFDEVDAGVGGRSADPIGRSLWQLARTHQVVCVTHLPQIAAYADTHLRIEKLARDGRTVTQVEELDGQARVAEIAQMLGAGARERGAVAAAQELLERARAAQRPVRRVA